MKSIKDFDVTGKKVLVRCDFNVPSDDDGNVVDDFKIKESLPTIRHLVEQGAKVILISHFDPESTGFVEPKYTFQGVANRLSKLLNMPVMKTDDCLGSKVQEKIAGMKNGELLLLENVRFHMGETDNIDEFAKKLAELGDLYVNEAFSVCHRAHASVVGVPKYLPHAAGLLLQKEVENLNKILENPVRPMVAVVGGAKVKTKAAFIENISNIADTVIISGLIQKEIIEKGISFAHSDKIIAPSGDLAAPDIDDASIELFRQKIMQSKTVVWNGPFGKFEDKQYKKGTLAIAKAIIDSGAFSVVGGGETLEFLRKEGLIEKFSHLSTGGGAMLAYLAGEKLPGIEALR